MYISEKVALSSVNQMVTIWQLYLFPSKSQLILLILRIFVPFGHVQLLQITHFVHFAWVIQ